MDTTTDTTAETTEHDDTNQQDGQVCKQCDDTVATLSTDGLCDGCVAEQSETPEPETPAGPADFRLHGRMIDAIVRAEHPEWEGVEERAASVGQADSPSILAGQADYGECWPVLALGDGTQLPWATPEAGDEICRRLLHMWEEQAWQRIITPSPHAEPAETVA